MNIDEFAVKYLGIVIQPHQKRWIDFLESVKHRGILMAPRGHGKTTTINFIWLSWVIVNNPDLRILLVSHSKEMAESFSRAVRNVMENPDLQQEFGFDTGTPWRANSWRLEQSPQSKPTLECKGALGRMTGWRGDMVIFDDLLEFSTAGEATQHKLDEWIKQEVLPAINPHRLDKVIVVGTRKHMDDWYGQLLLSPIYENLVDTAFLDEAETQALAPHIYDEHGNILTGWWNPEKLHMKKEEIGALKFAQEYMNRPSPKEGLELQTDWLQYYDTLPNVHLTYYMGVDPSGGSQSDRASYFAMVCVAHDPYKDEIYVVDLMRDKCSKRKQVQHAAEWMARYAPEACYIENVMEYTHVYDSLVKMFPNVREKDYIHSRLRGVQATKKEERIREVVAPEFERRRIFLKRPDLDPMVKTFLDYEYKAFPAGDMDLLDSLVLAIHSIVKVGILDTVPWRGV